MTDTNDKKEKTFESKTNKVLNIDDTTWFNLPTCKILIKDLKQLHDQSITEKDKEIERRKDDYFKMNKTIEKQHTQIAELQAENEKLKKENKEWQRHWVSR